jgi:hypothetical protein
MDGGGVWGVLPPGLDNGVPFQRKNLELMTIKLASNEKPFVVCIA